MKRRQALITSSVALGSAAAGGGLWRALHPANPHPTAEAQSAAPSPSLWAMRFEQPDGQPLHLAHALGAPLLLNFWATWCPPCLKEMPLLDGFYRQHRAQGWRVIGLAADNMPEVRAHLARQPVAFPIGLAGFGGIELSRHLGNTQGGLPFTVVFNRQGQQMVHKSGAITAEELALWTRAAASQP